jgi:predicted nucleic acid-binding protein
MNADFPVVLDACVLVPAALRDTLLRLAEKRLFLPRWSDEIIKEMVRTLRQKPFDKTETQTNYLLSELKSHFEDAWVQNYAPIIPSCTNHEKDRHVLAAAIKSNAELIVTFNLKDFPDASLEPWDIEALHPDDFLIDVFYVNPELVVHILHEQAAEIDRELKKQLNVMRQGLPKFVQLVADSLRIELPAKD